MSHAPIIVLITAWQQVILLRGLTAYATQPQPQNYPQITQIWARKMLCLRAYNVHTERSQPSILPVNLR
jgi:hypothetical protein